MDVVPDRCVVCGNESASPSNGPITSVSRGELIPDEGGPVYRFADGRDATSCPTHTFAEDVAASRLAVATGLINIEPVNEPEV